MSDAELQEALARSKITVGLQDAALDYVSRKLAVVPLHTVRWVGGEWLCTCNQRPCPHKPGKHPQQGYGLHHACTSENQVRHAWERMPDGNIGLVVPASLFVAELDGVEAIAWWDEHGGGGVLTRTALSGSGVGEHRWYRLPEGEAVRNGPLIKFEGEHKEVAIRAAGEGYLVAPPSLHASGNRYTWKYDGNAAQVPAALLAEIRAVRPSPNGVTPEAGADYLAQAAGLVHDQGRDSLMLRYLGALWEKSGGAREVIEAGAEAMQSRFGERLTDDQVRRHIDYIAGKEPGKAPINLALAANLETKQVPDPERCSCGACVEGDDSPDQIKVEDTDDPDWLVHWPGITRNDGWLRTKTDTLASVSSPWYRVQKEHVRQFLESPIWVPRDGQGRVSHAAWFVHLDYLIKHKKVVPVSKEETVQGQLAEFLMELCSDHTTVSDDPYDLVVHGHVWHDYRDSEAEYGAGRYVVTGKHLRVRLERARGQIIDRKHEAPALLAKLRLLTGKSQTVNFSVAQIEQMQRDLKSSPNADRRKQKVPHKIWAYVIPERLVPRDD